MVGDISSPRVIIVDGASFRGQVDMGNLEGARATAPVGAARPRPTERAATKPARPSGPPTKQVVVAPRPAAAATPPARAAASTSEARPPAGNGSPREATAPAAATPPARASRPAAPPPRAPTSPAKKQKVVLKRK